MLKKLKDWKKDFVKEQLPPDLSKLKKTIVYFNFLLMALALIYSFCQLCQIGFAPSLCFTYIALCFFLILNIFNRYLRHDIVVHMERLEDPSEVESLFVEAHTVEPRKHEIVKESYKKKMDELDNEVKRLETIGYRQWTDYQVLSLNQMLVDFLEDDDLIARARYVQDNLRDYAEDSAYPSVKERFYERRRQTDEAINKIIKVREEENSSQSDLVVKIFNATEKLRAELRSALEQVADFTKNWAYGTAVRTSLTILGVLFILILPVLGLLPTWHPEGDEILGIFNWGFLGMSGAITAGLWNIRKSDLVEVGDTEGRKEMWQAILGAALGYYAGILSFSIIAGGIISSGSIVPVLESSDWQDIGRSVICAVASGFSFEKIFERVISATAGGSS